MLRLGSTSLQRESDYPPSRYSPDSFA